MCVKKGQKKNSPADFSFQKGKSPALWCSAPRGAVTFLLRRDGVAVRDKCLRAVLQLDARPAAGHQSSQAGSACSLQLRRYL